MTNPSHERGLFVAIAVAIVGLSTASFPTQVWADPKRATAEADLDAKAYEAFANRDSAALASLKAAGADPARHARTDGEVLFDALRPQRSIAVLEFVLRNGADPKHPKDEKWRATPIGAAQLDLEKIRLLLEYGADPNAKGSDGYPAFFWVLFQPQQKMEFPALPAWEQAVRIYEKRSVVQLLLDHGMLPNRDYGGWGRSGALGFTRREDKDVIELLVARGATLTNERMGPVSTALQYERDDLAMALIAHDKKLQANDQLALVEAARRGFRDVTEALLRTGADPNVADGAGATALALAERRHDTVMIEALTKAGAKPPSARLRPDYRGKGWDEFDSAAAAEIDDVALFDPPRFALSMGLPKRPVAFVFYGKEAGDVETIECEQSSAFTLIAHANEVGHLKVGVCRRNVEQIREMAATAGPVIGALIRKLAGSGGIDDTQARQLGWTYEKSAGSNHSEQHYFPIIVVGHGIGTLPTLVLFPDRGDRAVIVQADDMQLCDHQPKIQTPLCENTKQALSDIAERLLTRASELAVAGGSRSEVGGDISGSGILLDSTTGEPIVGGLVKIECRRAKLWDRPQLVKEAALTTDTQGEYHYSFSASLKCQEFDVHPKKQGYVERGCSKHTDVAKYATLYQQKNARDFDLMPSVLCLTPESGVVMQQLEQKYRLSLGKTISAAECSLEAADYQRIYASFWESKQIAKTAAENTFIREHYCSRLIDLYAKLSADDLKYLQRFSVSPVANVHVDHQREVVDFCAGGPTTKRTRNSALGEN